MSVEKPSLTDFMPTNNLLLGVGFHFNVILGYNVVFKAAQC